MRSEVARILQQIEIGYRVTQHGLTGLTQSAKHAAIRLITERLETIPNERRY